MYLVEPLFNKDFLRSNISDECIFSYYLNHDIKINKKIYTNPLRLDNKPDCLYKYSQSGILYFIDYALGKQYDSISIVMEIFNLSFNNALLRIKEDLFHRSNTFDSNLINKIQINKNSFVKKEVIIKVKTIDWTKENIKYWNDYFITIKELIKFNIKPISYYWINDQIFKTKNSYCYYLGLYNTHKYKILNLNSDFKWITNSFKELQGYNQLPNNGNLLIITKSLKDVIVLSLFNIFSIATQSESNHLSEEQFIELSKRFKRIVVFYDNDKTGFQNSLIQSKKYNISQIHIPICEKKNKIKDISDYIKNYGIQKTKNLLKLLLCQNYN